jgi:hypothetical protein
MVMIPPRELRISGEALPEGVGGGLGPVVRADLQVDIGDVTLHRARAEAERPCDLMGIPAPASRASTSASRGDSPTATAMVVIGAAHLRLAGGQSSG